ncbi:hypothetical protein [Bosea sp. (in: a-proteobacteria)]|uniref:hypothetical protein n=1 Tax=Bosea sp. (in: a-proteobacteria) TaxID=1871050 RepID=UPI00262E70A4|nr:hypothetical protein [Bosea sp. (in: a-proteobacteria)]MCO5092192.1 hypothetical protein [Bosea sp. (in: a-proteobacteria)]
MDDCFDELYILVRLKRIRASLMKRTAIAVSAIIAFAGGAVAFDKLVLHPQRQAIKILRYASLADARRIALLEQQAVNLLKQDHHPSLAPVEACISHAVPAVKADYDALGSEFAKCKELIAAKIAAVIPSPSDEVTFLFFLTGLTSQLGAYGASDSTDARQIAKDDTLNCSQSMFFISQTTKALFPSIKVTEIALFNTALGAHGLVEARVNDRPFVLDGSTGTVYLASIRQMTQPGPKRVRMIDFFDEADPRLATLLEEMTRSVQLGWMKPSDIVSKHRL